MGSLKKKGEPRHSRRWTRSPAGLDPEPYRGKGRKVLAAEEMEHCGRSMADGKEDTTDESLKDRGGDVLSREHRLERQIQGLYCRADGGSGRGVFYSSLSPGYRGRGPSRGIRSGSWEEPKSSRLIQASQRRPSVALEKHSLQMLMNNV